MHTFAQLGLKAAVAVKQFQTLDTENRGYLEVREPDPNPNNANPNPDPNHASPNPNPSSFPNPSLDPDPDPNPNPNPAQVRELVAAFGTIPQVSKENALLMAQSVMRQMTAMRAKDTSPHAQDPVPQL